MKKHRSSPHNSGFGLVELLFVMLMIALFYFWKTGFHINLTGKMDPNTRREFARKGLHTATPVSTVQSVQNTLAGVQAAYADRQKQQEKNWAS
mgnify:CR=1 FL=1